jgi:hypothetical protein
VAIKDFPHPAKMPKVECAACHADQATGLALGVHAILGDAACWSCHGNVHEIAPGKNTARKMRGVSCRGSQRVSRKHSRSCRQGGGSGCASVQFVPWPSAQNSGI